MRKTETDDTHAQVNRPLLDEFATVLSERSWEIALLQEAPPRWLRPLADRCGAAGAIALTSRNSLPWLRARLADLNPDLIASGEGGSNQLLVRFPARMDEVRRLTLTEHPERRRMLFARVETPTGARLAVANLHATAHDALAAARDVELAAERAVEWAGSDPLLFGGDLNMFPEQQGEVFERLRSRHGLAPATAGAVDHLLARGFEIVEEPVKLPGEARELPGPDGLRIRLSDHAPVVGGFGMR
jgi:endonuclease/exonuclease/phosphatase family metal-dependent hydrolase